MAEIKCAKCKLRAQYDKDPRSFVGRFWKWHIRFCPGWKNYIKSLEKNEREAVKTRYHLAL